LRDSTREELNMAREQYLVITFFLFFFFLCFCIAERKRKSECKNKKESAPADGFPAIVKKGLAAYSKRLVDILQNQLATQCTLYKNGRTDF